MHEEQLQNSVRSQGLRLDSPMALGKCGICHEEDEELRVLVLQMASRRVSLLTSKYGFNFSLQVPVHQR